MYIFFREMSMQILCLCLNCIVFLLSFKNSLHILDVSALSNIHIPNIFFPVCGFIVFFEGQKCLIN